MNEEIRNNEALNEEAIKEENLEEVNGGIDVVTNIICPECGAANRSNRRGPTYCVACRFLLKWER